jgi:hypothetical protein
VLAPALAFGARWAARPGASIAAVLAVLSLLGLLIKALPMFAQGNGALIALALPANVGLALALYRLAREAPAGWAAGTGRSARPRQATAA